MSIWFRYPPTRPGTKGNIHSMFVLLLLVFFDMCVEREVSGSHLRETCHGRLLNKTLYKPRRMGLTVHAKCLIHKHMFETNSPTLIYQVSAVWNGGSRLEPYGTQGSGLAQASMKHQPYGTEVPGWSRTEPKVPGSPKLR